MVEVSRVVVVESWCLVGSILKLLSGFRLPFKLKRCVISRVGVFQAHVSEISMLHRPIVVEAIILTLGPNIDDNLGVILPHESIYGCSAPLIFFKYILHLSDILFALADSLDPQIRLIQMQLGLCKDRVWRFQLLPWIIISYTIGPLFRGLKLCLHLNVTSWKVLVFTHLSQSATCTSNILSRPCFITWNIIILVGLQAIFDERALWSHLGLGSDWSELCCCIWRSRIHL